VIATVGSEAKAALARDLGADHVILYGEEDVAGPGGEITGGQGVAVVYDGVGKDTFEASLKSLGRRGVLATFGNASGPAPAVRAAGAGGQVAVPHPAAPVRLHRHDRRAGRERRGAVRGAGSGAVKIEVGQTFPLAEARAAHEALEGRRTTGATLLIP
jgi:NADPH2:quinone reductase